MTLFFVSENAIVCIMFYCYASRNHTFLENGSNF